MWSMIEGGDKFAPRPHRSTDRGPALEEVQNVFIELSRVLQHREVADAGLNQQSRIGYDGRHLLDLTAINRLVVVAIGDDDRYADTAQLRR